MELFVLRNTKEVDNFIHWLKNERLPLKVMAQFIDRQRTLEQNAYLFGVVYKAIADYTGHSIDEVHNELSIRHNVEFSYNPRIGEFQLRVKSTTEFSPAEMGWYIDKIISEAIDLGINIPEANEVIN